jgi:hypothetical protein
VTRRLLKSSSPAGAMLLLLLLLLLFLSFRSSYIGLPIDRAFALLLMHHQSTHKGTGVRLTVDESCHVSQLLAGRNLNLLITVVFPLPPMNIIILGSLMPLTLR